MSLRGALIPCLALMIAGCGITKAPTPIPTPTVVDANILANNGFEAGLAPWTKTSLTTPAVTALSISDVVARTGRRSVELDLTSADEGSGAVAALQTVSSKEMPEFVAGFYRIDEWQPHALFQYLYLSVTIRGGDFADPAQPHEMRFLTGARIEPSLEPGVVYVFLDRGPPVLGTWTYFSYPIRRAFERFGPLPPAWDSIDISVGVRYDGQRPPDAIGSAKVLYDDLFLGPQPSNPYRPPNER